MFADKSFSDVLPLGHVNTSFRCEFKMPDKTEFAVTSISAAKLLSLLGSNSDRAENKDQYQTECVETGPSFEAKVQVRDGGGFRTVAKKYRSQSGKPHVEWLEPKSQHRTSVLYLELPLREPL